MLGTLQRIDGVALNPQYLGILSARSRKHGGMEPSIAVRQDSLTLAGYPLRSGHPLVVAPSVGRCPRVG
jgi:hypothetical protein